MRIAVALLVTQVGLLGACTSFDLGRTQSAVAGGEWLENVDGGDAYIKMHANVSPAEGYSKDDACTTNVGARYVSRETNSSLFAGIDDAGNIPIMSVIVSDSKSACDNIFSSRDMTPAVILPEQGLGA